MTIKENHQLIAYLHNGANISVTGNPVSIDMLRSLIVPVELVKAVNVFDIDAKEYVSKTNYTALTEERLGSKLPLDPEPFVWGDPDRHRDSDPDAHDSVYGYVKFKPRSKYNKNRDAYPASDPAKRTEKE